MKQQGLLIRIFAGATNKGRIEARIGEIREAITEFQLSLQIDNYNEIKVLMVYLSPNVLFNSLTLLFFRRI